MSAQSPTEASASSPKVSNLQVPQLNQPSTLSRPFRSRKNRPCDACRKAKTRCAIPNPGPPCVECQQTGKQCTFDELPPVRKRAPPKRPLTPETGSPDMYHDEKRPRNHSHATTPVAAHGLEALMQAAARERESQLRIAAKKSVMETQPSQNSTFIDPSSLDMSITDALEPYAITALLTDDLLPIGSTGYRQASSDDTAQEGHIRQISKDRAHPQYVIFSKRLENPPLQTPPPIANMLALLHPPPTVPALVTLYLTASNVAFPLFTHPSTGDPSRPYFAILDPVVGAKAAFTALSHSPLYRSSAKAARQILFNNGPSIAPGDGRLSGIGCALLELSARDKDVRSAAQNNYLTMAMTIAQAQLLGLHIDCTNWSIPEWEKDLRRALWWALKVHDAWMSFLNSRPCHIQRDNTNVSLPTLNTILHLTSPSPVASTPYVSPTSAVPDNRTTSAQSFILLCRLSLLVASLQAHVCTLAAAGGVSNSSLPGVGQPASREDRLRKVGIIEGDAATLLDEVRHTLGPSRDTGVVSLMTCLLGFRCMLRRIFIELNIGLGSPFTPDPETLDMYADAVDYVCSLEGVDFDGFWLTYVSHILSSLTSSLIRLSLATTNSSSGVLSPPLSSVGDPNQPRSQSPQSSHLLQANTRTNPLILLSRLLSALHKAKVEFHWEMVDAALARAESVAACLRTTDEFSNVVAALEGRFEPRPPPPPQLPPQHPQITQAQQTYVPTPAAWNIDLNAFGMDWMDGLMNGALPVNVDGNGYGAPDMQHYGAR